MSFASALNVLQPTLPYYLAVKQFDLLRITPHRFEFHPHSEAPAIALSMVSTVFQMGASSCIETLVMSRTLAEGPKLFTFDALTCEALENFDLSLSTTDYQHSPSHPSSSSFPPITLASVSFPSTPASTPRITSLCGTNRKRSA